MRTMYNLIFSILLRLTILSCFVSLFFSSTSAVVILPLPAPNTRQTTLDANPVMPYRSTVKSHPFEASYEFRLSRTGLGQFRRSGRIVRDSAGRVREEMTLENVAGAFASVVIISDPVLNATWTLELQSKTGKRSNVSGFNEPEVEFAEDSGPTAQSLGTKLIEGLECRGHRTQGDGFDIEYWYSPDLRHVVLEVDRSEKEERVYRLFDIRRGEPDASNFDIPKDFKIARK